MSVIDRMKSYLPTYYRESLTVQSLTAAGGGEVDSLKLAVQDVLDQMFIDTATWGLDFWEAEYRIKKSSRDTIVTRRSRLKAFTRSGVTMTPARLEEVVLAYVTAANITYNDAGYKFTVQILKPLGVPELDINLLQAVEELRPAHLDFEIKYSYNTWQVYASRTWASNAGKTWYELSTQIV